MTRNVWLPSVSSTYTLRYRTQKKPKREKEGGRTVFFPTRQSGNACSVCPWSVLPRLWGAVRHGTGEKKKKKKLAVASHHLRPLHLAVPSQFFIGFIAFLTIRAHRLTKFARTEEEFARRTGKRDTRNRKLLGKMMMIEIRIP